MNVALTDDRGLPSAPDKVPLSETFILEKNQQVCSICKHISFVYMFFKEKYHSLKLQK